MDRRIVAFAAAIALIVAGVRAAPAGSDAANNDVRAAVRVLAAARQGFIGFHRHLVSDQRAPGHNELLDAESGRLRSGDRVVEARLYRQVTNGRVATVQELAKAQAEVDRNPPGDDYRLPLSDDALADYRFEAARCDGCTAGSVAIAFTSAKRDEEHGDGTMVVDAASHHVLHLQFVPARFPQHVDAASITMTFGNVLPGLWDLVETNQHYSGHMLFLHGGADIATTLSNYRRFSSLDEGRKALAAGI